MRLRSVGLDREMAVHTASLCGMVSLSRCCKCFADCYTFMFRLFLRVTLAEGRFQFVELLGHFLEERHDDR